MAPYETILSNTKLTIAEKQAQLGEYFTKPDATLFGEKLTGKIAVRPNAVIPLMRAGDYGTAFPPGYAQNLITDCRDNIRYFVTFRQSCATPQGLTDKLIEPAVRPVFSTKTIRQQ
ncbi:MAG: hypothetical protein KDH94_05800, partial [Coxiellaceae bacterium]|nr:hypothetical protein [Coxiellaceae bacterium]